MLHGGICAGRVVEAGRGEELVTIFRCGGDFRVGLFLLFLLLLIDIRGYVSNFLRVIIVVVVVAIVVIFPSVATVVFTIVVVPLVVRVRLIVALK